MYMGQSVEVTPQRYKNLSRDIVGCLPTRTYKLFGSQNFDCLLTKATHIIKY